MAAGCLTRWMGTALGVNVMGIVPKSQPARGFMHQFWAKETKYKKDHSQRNKNNLFKGAKNLRIRIDHKRPSFIKIARDHGFSSLMRHESGRKRMMEKMVKGERKFAEFD